MTVRPLRLLEGNDETVNVGITRSGGAYNLTGAIVQMIIKPNVGTVEDPPATGVVILSTATGEVTVTSATGGTVAVDVAAGTVTAGTWTYRVDVIDATGRRTAVYGDLTVIDL